MLLRLLLLFCMRTSFVFGACPLKYKCIENIKAVCFGELIVNGLKLNQIYKIVITLESLDRMKLDDDGSETITFLRYNLQAKYNDDPGSVELVGTKEQINEKLRNKKSLIFNINFPQGKRTPLLKNVLINGRTICTKEPHSDTKAEIILKYTLDTSDTTTIQEIPVIDPPQIKISACGQQKVNSKELILNGYDTYPGKWPYHAAIYQIKTKQRLYACGGTLIGEFHVLTAAHCVYSSGYPISPSAIIVQLGVYNLELLISETLQEHAAREILVHPKFNKLLRNDDVAIILLNTRVKFTTFVQPVCLYNRPDVGTFPNRGLIGTTIGWGRTETKSLSTVPKEVRMPFVDFNKCLNSNRDVFGRFLTVEMFCAGNRNGSNVCDGDSGGGMYIYENEAWNLVGIVAFTAQNNLRECSSDDFAVFMDVSQYFNWINQQAGVLLTPTFDELEENKMNELIIFYQSNYFPNAPQNEVRIFIRKIREIEAKESDKVEKIKEKQKLKWDLLDKYPPITKGETDVHDFLFKLEYLKEEYPNAPSNSLESILIKRNRILFEFVNLPRERKTDSELVNIYYKMEVYTNQIKALDPISTQAASPFNVFQRLLASRPSRLPSNFPSRLTGNIFSGLPRF